MSSPQMYVPTGDLTIATVREFKAALVDMTSDGKSGTLDLAGVLRVDAAALQVPPDDANAAYGAAAPRCEWRLGIPVATWGGDALGVATWDAGKPEWKGGSAEAEFDGFMRNYPQSILVHAAVKRIGRMHGEGIALERLESVEARARTAAAAPLVERAVELIEGIADIVHQASTV